MKLDLSCPIELRGYTLTCEDEKVIAVLRLYNLTNRRIDSFEAVAKWRNTSGRCLACPFTADHLRAAGESIFSFTLSTDRLPDADTLELLFTSVRYEDGTPDWRPEGGPYAEMEPLPFLTSDELSQLRRTFGEDAVCRPRQDDQIWLCTCGRMNANETGVCARCHRTRDRVLHGDAEPLEVVPPKSTTASFETLQAKCLRRNARLLRRTFVVAIAALAVTVFLVLNSPDADVQTTAAEVAFSQQ